MVNPPDPINQKVPDPSLVKESTEETKAFPKTIRSLLLLLKLPRSKKAPFGEAR